MRLCCLVGPMQYEKLEQYCKMDLLCIREIFMGWEGEMCGSARKRA